MDRIEYGTTLIQVPTSWDDITVGHYETFYGDVPVTARERAALVAKVCQVSPEEILDLPVEGFDAIVDRLGFLFADNPAAPDPVITVDGVKYIIPIEDSLSTGAWIDAEEIQKSEAGNLSGLLAIVCRPAGEAYNLDDLEARAAMFAALPVSKILGALAFFLRCTYALETNIKAFSKVAALAALLPRNIPTSLRPGGGIKLLTTWRRVRYWITIILLNYRLRQYLRTYNIEKIRTAPKTPSGS